MYEILYSSFCPECGKRAWYKSCLLDNKSIGYCCPDGHKWEEEIENDNNGTCD